MKALYFLDIRWGAAHVDQGVDQRVIVSDVGLGRQHVETGENLSVFGIEKKRALYSFEFTDSYQLSTSIIRV